LIFTKIKKDEGFMTEKKEEESGGLAGPAIFITVVIAILAFFAWFL